MTYDVADWMNNIQEFDYIVIGEGEETFKQLLTEMNSTMNMENVHGLAFRKTARFALTHSGISWTYAICLHRSALKKIFPTFLNVSLI